MKAVFDYLKRIFLAVFLCPVAAVAWLAFGASGFSPNEFMRFLGSLAQLYASMDASDQSNILFQGIFSWAVLAFVFVLVSFVVNPPTFSYGLKRRSGKPVATVVELGAMSGDAYLERR